MYLRYRGTALLRSEAGTPAAGIADFSTLIAMLRLF